MFRCCGINGTNSSSDIVLENFTVLPVSLSSVLLEWKVVPTDGYHCITSYDIQVSGPNGSQWGEQISGASNSYYFTGLQLTPFQEYTYCVIANLSHNQTGPAKQTLTVSLQGTLICAKFITMIICIIMLQVCVTLYLIQNPTLQQILVQLYDANKGMKYKLNGR